MSTFPRRFLFVLLMLSVTSCTVSAQAPSGPPKPHQRPPLTSVVQEQFVAYWTTETGWTSELQLRNNASGQDLVVTPFLRLPVGAETTLDPVTIRPQEVKSVDLAAAIASAAAPQFIGAYGSVVLRYRSPYTPSVGNKLTATIEQTDVINCRYDMNNSACQTISY